MIRTLAVGVVCACLGAVSVAVVTQAGDSQPTHYTVEASDTWRSIATAHGVTADALQVANNTAASTSDSSHPLTGRILHVPEAAPTTTPASTVAPTTTSAPATTAPATTASPSTTPSSTTSPSSSSTSPTSSPSTTSPGAGVQFSESFSDPSAFYARFDHMWSGELHSGAIFNPPDDANDWPGDHDMSCGDPNATKRTIHLGNADPWATGQGDPAAAEQAFYPCLPGGDPAKGHVMTSVNTEGYVVAWFAPKQSFVNVKTVCWDQNIQNLGGGKWTQVLFLTQAEWQNAKMRDLGFTSPEFPNNGGPSTLNGSASHGVKLEGGRMTAWSQLGEWNQGVPGNVQRPFPGDVGTTTDKAPRYRQCVTDNGNGTLTAVRSGPAGTVASSAQGDIPDGQIKVVFADDNYNPDKHFNANGIPRNSGPGYTWHWDSITIS